MSDFYCKTGSGEWTPIKGPVEGIDTEITSLYAEDMEYLGLKENVVFQCEIPSINPSLHEAFKNLAEAAIRAEKKLIEALASTGLYTAEQLKDYGIEPVGNALQAEKQIEILERKKKHCKNYLELKQIDRELNSLKFGRRKR